MWNKDDILKIYNKYNIKASKRFGQNFLIDKLVLESIISVSKIKNKNVIEIGPGLGSLSMYLLKDAHKVTAYEIDEDMIKVLSNEINNKNFSLIHENFLVANLDFKGKKNVVANIPYNITSDIIFKLFENSEKLGSATLMVQKEVGKRITSKVGSKNYGKLSISSQHFADVKYEFDVSKNSFFPVPKVDSAIITFNFKNKNFKNSKDFLLFINQCFSMRRKTLYNNLKVFFNGEKAKEIILTLNKDLRVRPQELSYDEYIKLFNNVK